MPSTIAEVFARCRAEHRAALIAYVTGGHPSLADTVAALPAIADAGADLIEVGLPFSDPIADGPVIAEAMHEALVAGVTPGSVLDAVAGLTTLKAPALAMVSYSIVHRIGVAPFVKSVADAGLRGLIVPDLDVEAEAIDGASSIGQRCADLGVDLVLLASPTTAPRRLELIARASRGFVYVLARTGITGDRSAAASNANSDASHRSGSNWSELARRIEALRSMTDTPLAVGFGISTPEHVAQVAQIADGVIVGTALVRRMGAAGVGRAAAAATESVRALAAATERRVERNVG